MDADPATTVRVAAEDELAAAAGLLCELNREFGEPAPPPPVLARRLDELVADGETVVLLADHPPAGVAVLRLRPALWTTALECYLAELYVVPARRRTGIGRALMRTAIAHARGRGADRMEIGVDAPDHAARALYESLGFTNRSDGAVMYVYERDL